MNKDIVRHVSGDHVCWTRTLENGDVLFYTKDQKLKADIMMANSKWINTLADDDVSVYDGNELLIAILAYGHCLLVVDNELEGFKLITSNRVGKFKI